MTYVPPASVPDKENFENEVAADRAKAKDPVSPSFSLTTNSSSHRQCLCCIMLKNYRHITVVHC